MVVLGCVDCSKGTYYRPEFIYIYEGVSICDFHLNKRRMEAQGLPIEVPKFEEGN